MAGHILRDSFMPVDYNEIERSNLVLSEFHHIVDAAFFIFFPMIFYFSGTGNSKWIATQLSETQQEKKVFIPDALRDGNLDFTLREDEKIGFVFPIYSWGPPPIVMRFIEQVHLSGYIDQYLFFVCSCGDDTGLTQQMLLKAFADKGWKCQAGFSVIMPNNYVLFPGFDVDTQDVEIAKLQNASSTLEQIQSSIIRKETVFSCKEGSMPFLKSRIIYPLFVRYGIWPQKFYATNDCISCGKCERACPVENIRMKEGKPIWEANCTSCLACYHICPKHAVQYGKKTKNKGHYFNPNI